MNKRTMNGQMIEEFGSYLENEEKSPATLEKFPAVSGLGRL